MIGVVVVDDQELVRAGLKALAEHDGDIRVMAEAENGREGIRAVQQHRPDIALVDIRMPLLDGIAVTRAIVADPLLSATRVIILTTFDDDESIEAAIAAGAAGYLLKDLSPLDLRRAIRIVAAGEALLAPSVTSKVLASLVSRADARVRPELIAGLTEREREVLGKVALGESNTEIGHSLSISPATARTYVSRLLSKLHARDRSRLVALGYESGLVTPGARSDGG
jgi:DNA-binding NarL/FixJ family response regulator